MQDITTVWTADPGIQCQDFAKLRHTHTHTHHRGTNFYIREFGALRIFLLVKTYHLNNASILLGITFLKEIWLTIHSTSYYSPSVVNKGHPSTPIQGLIGPLFNLLNIRTQDMFNTTCNGIY